jgi:hypothetical protein
VWLLEFIVGEVELCPCPFLILSYIGLVRGCGQASCVDRHEWLLQGFGCAHYNSVSSLEQAWTP